MNTVTLPHIFMWVLIPKFLIIVVEAHKREYYLEKYKIKSWLKQLVHVTL